MLRILDTISSGWKRIPREYWDNTIVYSGILMFPDTSVWVVKVGSDTWLFFPVFIYSVNVPG